MKIYDTLYKRTKTGAVQSWFQEQNGDSWRSTSGQVDGAMVTSAWHKCFPKNEGKKNGTTGEQQAAAEIEANYTKRLKLGYHRDVADIDKPIRFEPMLAKKFQDRVGKIKFQDGVYSQPKLDGMRCIITVDGMFSRTGEKIPSAPHIHEEMLAHGLWDSFTDYVYDGELYNHELHDNFDEIMSLARKTKPTAEDLEKSKAMLQFHMYDIYTGGDDLFSERFHMLGSEGESFQYVKFVETTRVNSFDEIDALFDRYLAEWFEGQMIRTDAPYENKRSPSLLKRKDFIDEEFELVDIVEGVGNRSGMAGRATLRMKDGRTFGAGIKGSHAYSVKMLEEKQKYIGGDTTVRYFRLTPDGKPRFGVAVMFYEGKRNV